jgi:membrane protein DedA with SNARE-associated domain
MVGVTALFPVLWFVILSVISAMIYSIYLLYSGVPIMMNIPKEKSFIYASSVVTCGLVILISLIAITAMMWTTGFGPAFVN